MVRIPAVGQPLPQGQVLFGRPRAVVPPLGGRPAQIPQEMWIPPILRMENAVIAAPVNPEQVFGFDRPDVDEEPEPHEEEVW